MSVVSFPIETIKQGLHFGMSVNSLLPIIIIPPITFVECPTMPIRLIEIYVHMLAGHS